MQSPDGSVYSSRTSLLSGAYDLIMAEDLCLIQYVRDSFGESEYMIPNTYVIADDGDDTILDTYCCLDYVVNTFDQSPGASTADPCNPDSTTPDLFSSLSPQGCTDSGPDAAMESVYGGHSLQLSSSIRNYNSLQGPLRKGNEYPMLAAYIGLPNNLLEFDQSGGNTCTSTSGNITSSSELGARESRTSFWRGKSPALLMQQLKGPSLSGSSCSSVRGQFYSLPSLSEQGLNSSTKFKDIVSSGRVNEGQARILRSNGVTDAAHLKQRRIDQIMPGLDILGERRNSGSWSSSSTSPGPSSTTTDQDIREVAAGKEFMYNSTMSGDREVVMDRDRAWKKAKREPKASTTSGAVSPQTADRIDQRERTSHLQEKLLALLRTFDSSTSKDCKAQILDDSIGYLKELRKRLISVNEADDSYTTRAESPVASPSDGLASLEDLELETAGVELSPHLNVDNGPQIEVRMMENQHVMVKLTAKDRPGLFNDIMVVLRTLRLDIQHANIRTSNNGQRHDIFAAKMQLPFFSSQSTHSIAMALNQVINDVATTTSPEPHTSPQVSASLLLDNY